MAQTPMAFACASHFTASPSTHIYDFMTGSLWLVKEREKHNMGQILGISAPYASEKQVLYYTLARCAGGKVGSGEGKFSPWAELRLVHLLSTWH